jgi:hypothetical protein
MAFLTMEASPPRLCDLVVRLAEGFPCNSLRFSPRCTRASKDPEPPRQTPNLSPEPKPKGESDL